jgi:hypothetical protein
MYGVIKPIQYNQNASKWLVQPRFYFQISACKLAIAQGGNSE